MSLFYGKKVPVNFFKAKEGVFLERLNNGVISQDTYNQVKYRILFLERTLSYFPFYTAYIKGSLSKKEFLQNLKGFAQQLIELGVSRREIQEIIQQVELNEAVIFQNIAKEEVSVGNIKGTIFKIGEGHRNGIVISHGISAFRYNLLNLADILARLGYLVLAIDLPKHNLNQEMDLNLGNIAELIRDSVMYLRRTKGVRNVAVIGHSLGSIGTLLASSGYTRRAEMQIYGLWERITQSIERAGKFSKLQPGVNDITLQDMVNDEGFMNLLNEIAAYYKLIKEIIFESLKMRDRLGYSFVDCCIFLSMPAECKKTFTGASLLKKLPDKWVKSIWEKMMHNPQIKLVMKEGNIFDYIKDNSKSLKWWYLRAENPHDFINYFMNAKEPADFISLINILSRFSAKYGKISFIEYYRKKYVLAVPKLFIYGKWDILLKPFIPGSKKKLLDTYGAYGNAAIIEGEYGHILAKKRFKQMVAVAVTDDRVLKNIINFLNRHMNPNRIPGYS